MTKNEFYRVIEGVINRQLTELEDNLLYIAWDIDDNNKEKFNEGTLESSAYLNVPEFIPLEDVPYRAVKGKYGYWLYDHTSKTWIINLSKGLHEHLAGVLYSIYNNDISYNTETNAERYIEELYGFFVSGSMNMYIPIKDDRYEINPDEEIFNTLKGKLSWRGI